MMLRTTVAAVSTVALSVFLTGVTAAPSYAAGGTLDLWMNNPPRITGEAWPMGSTVRVCRGSQELAQVDTDPFGSFSLDLHRNAHVGEKYTVTAGGTCAAPGPTSTSMIASLSAPTVDVAQGWIYGNGGSGASSLTVMVGNQYDGVLATDTVTPNPDGTWAAFAGTAAFDLMKGVGVGLHLQFPNGSVRRNSQVSNPTISVWDTHGVAASGWAPNTALHMTLHDPGTGDSHHWTVTTDENGGYWDVPPDPGWQVLRPGWIASATGTVENREVTTLTKTINLPDPLPFPTSMAGNVATGTLLGTVTNATIGAGSYIEATAVCRSDDWPQRAQLTGPSGAYQLDFTAAPVFPWDNGTACVGTTVYFGFNVRDLDGDEVSLNWHASPQPQVVVPDVVYNGQPGDVTGGGFDLMAVEIAQCQMNGSTVVGCDPQTTLLTNTNPDPQWDEYPLGYGQFSESLAFQRYLSVGSTSVDCAKTPGTCAVVVSEPNRATVKAFAPLTFGFDPYIQTQPADNLVDGAAITLTGRDFPPNATFNVDLALGYGSAQGGLVDHSTWWMGSVTTDANGSFYVPMKVSRQLHISPMPGDPKLDIDCATVAAASSDRLRRLRLLDRHADRPGARPGDVLRAADVPAAGWCCRANWSSWRYWAAGRSRSRGSARRRSARRDLRPRHREREGRQEVEGFLRLERLLDLDRAVDPKIDHAVEGRQRFSRRQHPAVETRQ